jgi:hypothetical protein
MRTECPQSALLPQSASVAASCLHQGIMMMTNNKLSRLLHADCSPQTRHRRGINATGAIAGDGLHRPSAGAFLDRSFAHYSNKPSQIDLLPGERLAVQDRERLSRCEDRALATSPELASATYRGRNSHDTAMQRMWDSSKTRVIESPRGLLHANEEAVPLPHWTRATRPSRAGMFIPGLLITFAVLAAANSILSTVLALVWL